MKKRYRLYIDESGDHTYHGLDNPSRRYLGLTGCFVESESYRTRLQPRLEVLKQLHFPHNPDDPFVLHREDIVNRRGPFWRLADPAMEQRFNADLFDFLCHCDYGLITVVIDKQAHVERHRAAAYHPYHYCLAAMLERYCWFLNTFNAEGDVMAESRGGSEDKQLKAAYEKLHETGTYFRHAEFFQRVLTSKEIKLKPKQANIAGLQLADLLAHPCKQDILIAEGRIDDPGDTFGRRVCNCIGPKYNRHSDGRVKGFGKIFLKK